MLFKKKYKDRKMNDQELSKKLPTYYEKFANNIEEKNYFYKFQLVNNSEEEFEIYYYGKLYKNKLIIGTNDARSLIVAKDKFGNEIILFDGFTHGYDNLTWQVHEDKELNFERTLSKLDIGFVKVFIYVTLLDATEDDWELDSDYNVTCDHGKKVPWDIFKRNAITWLSIKVITSKNKKLRIVDEELA